MRQAGLNWIILSGDESKTAEESGTSGKSQTVQKQKPVSQKETRNHCKHGVDSVVKSN
jgi:hypothetical protein